MSRHAQPRPSGGWLSLVLAVIAALGGASLASHVAAGPGRVAIGWTTVLAAALFLIQHRSERRTSLRLARIDHARRRDAIRLREEIAEAHQRSRLAVERSYAAVARSEALAAEVSRLLGVMASMPANPPTVQLLPAPTPAAVPSARVQPAPVQQARPAPLMAPAPVASARGAVFAPSRPGPSFDLPLVASQGAGAPTTVPINAWRETPVAPRKAASSSAPIESAESGEAKPVVPATNRVDLRAVESARGYARGA